MTYSDKTSKHPPAKPKPKRISSGRPRRGSVFNGQERYSVCTTDTDHDENIVRNYPASAFWLVAKVIMQMAESDRIEIIQKGVSTALVSALTGALTISMARAANLLNLQISELRRLMEDGGALDAAASERFDRIAQIAGMAEDILESREEAAKWLTRAHPLLNQETPLHLCHTELGAGQVKRVLSAIEWGNVA